MDNHRRVINALIDVIREQGIQGVSVQSVAREAEMDEHIVASFYDNKNRLLDGILIHINEERIPQLDQILSELHPKEIFFHQYLRWVRFLYDEQDFFIILDEMGEYYGKECYDVMPAFTLKDALQKCKDEHMVADGNIDDQLKLINGRLMGFARWIHGENKLLFDVFMVSYMNSIWDLIKDPIDVPPNH